MLGADKRRRQILNFLLDVVASFFVMAAVFFALYWGHDAFVLFMQGATGYPFHIQRVDHLLDNGWIFVVIVLCLFLALHLNRFYTVDLFSGRRVLLRSALKSFVTGLALTVLFFYAFRIVIVNRSLLLLFYLVFFAYLLGKEYVLRRRTRRVHFEEHPLDALLVCGPEQLQHELAGLRDNKEMRALRVRGVVSASETEEVADGPEEAPMLGALENLPRVLSSRHWDIVLVGVSALSSAQTILDAAQEQGVEAWVLTDFVHAESGPPRVDTLGDRSLLVYESAPHYKGCLLEKRLLDITGSLLLLVIFAPLLLGIAVAIKWDSRGPVFFRQRRTGWRGEEFNLWKFRTMEADAEERREQLAEANEMRGPVFKVRKDPRVTRIGRWLRRYSLDEFPQLWNVLRGEMSLVGPRPLPVYETVRYPAFRDRRRLSVLPGLTGLWQVSGRNEIADFSEWVRLDLEYIERWSLWLDLRILFRTVPVILRARGAS